LYDSIEIPNTNTFTIGKNLTYITMTHGENRNAGKHGYVGSFLFMMSTSKIIRTHRSHLDFIEKFMDFVDLTSFIPI
jgi:hypothetical protein